jgi:hypothetical protein
MALVAMAALAIILSVVTRQIVAQRQMLDQRHRQFQAEWLARAGVEVAAGRLLRDASAYTEDRKDLLPESEVHIAVEKMDQDSYRVTVDAVVAATETAPTGRTTRRHFRRVEKGGEVSLQPIPIVE